MDINRDVSASVEPGVYRVMAGRSSEDILPEGEFEVEP